MSPLGFRSFGINLEVKLCVSRLQKKCEGFSPSSIICALDLIKLPLSLCLRILLSSDFNSSSDCIFLSVKLCSICSIRDKSSVSLLSVNFFL